MNPLQTVAGIDVHKAMLAVVVARPGEERETEWARRKFGATVAELGELAAWLAARGVRVVVMESTAQYWKPVWMALEKQFELQLAQARSNKAPRGRKSDYADARRLVKRWRAEDLTLSYVPDAEQRRWRAMTRFQLQAVRQRVQMQNQIEALLEEGRIKLSCVVSDLLGATGLRILRALAAGETDIQKLAELRDRRLAATEEEVRAALEAPLEAAYRPMLRRYLEQVELIDRQLHENAEQLSEAMAAHQEAIARLCELPGVRVNAAQQVIAQIGPQAAAFPSPEQLASWAGFCPGREESAGVVASQRSPKGNRPLRRIVLQSAWAAVRAAGSYFQILFRRWIPRLGVKKAIWAVAHRLLRMIWKLLHERVKYEERGPRGKDPAVIQRRLRRLLRECRKLGYQATLEPLKP